MTTRIAKAATFSAAAVTVVIALLAYSAAIAPASAQAPTTTTTQISTSTTYSGTASTGSNGSYGPPGGMGGHLGWPPPGGPGLGNWGGPDGRGFGFAESRVNVSVGQTITLTSTSGVFHVVGKSTVNGTASGTLTFKVTGSLAEGYALSLTSGSIVVNGTTYAIASGSAQMNPSANVISGQGTATAGAFLVQATAHGNFVSSSGVVSLDFKAGTTEYLINLATTVQG